MVRFEIMDQIVLTKSEARAFLVKAHLMDGPRYKPGISSIRKILKRFSAVQVDSINVCGTNQEIVCNSRIEHYTEGLLDSFLYKKRGAFEYWSKCLCVIPSDAKPFYEYRMKTYRTDHSEFLKEYSDTVKHVLSEITANGPMLATEFSDDRLVDSFWEGKMRLVKRVLEVLWETGDLMISGRKARQRIYDLSSRCIASSGNKVSKAEYFEKLVTDRLKAMRLFRTRGGSGNIWHGIREERDSMIKRLDVSNLIIPVRIEGVKGTYAMLPEDRKFLKRKLPDEKHVRLLAPLDSMTWDRKLIHELFDFECKFEVYHPRVKRRWGYYCLPILYGDSLVGRLDLARDKQDCSLKVISIHYEENTVPDADFEVKLAQAICDHARFLSLERVKLPTSRRRGITNLRKLVKNIGY